PGFTLVELLVVMVVIALLGTIIIGSAQVVVRISRDKRYSLTCQVLKTALWRYRSEYNRWPTGGMSPDPKTLTLTVQGADNSKVFDMLREGSSGNPKGIRFLDETTLFTVVSGERIALSRAPSELMPLVYADRDTGTNCYFNVVFDMDSDSVDVK
ncbi:MAG: prepilin-type N-terminal cleavage/methylation domain-containing protein, partial [Kiritimatiellae bacterium]|nr:prepilin-type N-terminal cleavage/methylation domain-containing protein [Kiritimatiellia bacterium]